MTNEGRDIRGVIFDLDGVLVTTDELHFRAWKELADREGIPFTRHDNERLRGVDRMRSLEIILERSTVGYTPEQRAAMAEAKNTRYRQLLGSIGPAEVLPGAAAMLEGLRSRGVSLAVGSASRNAREILRRTGLESRVDAIVDGTDVTRAKPDPEVFLLAATRLGLAPGSCMVIEDGAAGIEAALGGGFQVIGIGDPARLGGDRGVRCVPGLEAITVEDVLAADPSRARVAEDRKVM